MLALRVCRAIKPIPASRLCKTLPSLWFSSSAPKQAEMSAPKPSKRPKTSSQLEQYASEQKVSPLRPRGHFHELLGLNLLVLLILILYCK